MEINFILETINSVLQSRGLAALTRKKTTTHGGEWCGPCPRCAEIGTGGRNEDRFLVWPERPAHGQGVRDNPCFTCRQCKEERFGKMVPWSGDLVTFYMWAHKMEREQFGQALDELGLSNSGGAHRRREAVLRPTSVTGAPNEQWQKRALQLILDAEHALWEDVQGKKGRKYLKKRVIKEETARNFHLGYIDVTSYEQAEEWGLDGNKLFIPRGIVIPEYHRTVRDGVVYREVWSVSIRRDPMDIANEELEAEDGKKVAKYHVIRGSERGMYAYEEINDDLPVLIVEGQLDALTAMQEAGDLVSAVATQSASGGRSATWLSKIVTSPFVLLGFDPDSAGKEAYTYWCDVIEEERRLHWTPQSGDLNAMLCDGGDVRAFLAQGVEILRSFSDIVLPLREARKALKAPEPLITHLQEENPQIFVSGASSDIEDVDDRVECDECHFLTDPVEMEVLPLGENVETPEDLVMLCPSCYARAMRLQEEEQKHVLLCAACGSGDVMYTQGEHYDKTPLYWCRPHFAAATLMQHGALINYRPFRFEAGEGYVSTGETIQAHEGRGGYVGGGLNGYLEFIRDVVDGRGTQQDNCATLWRAAQWAHILATGQEDLVKKLKEREEKAARGEEAVIVDTTMKCSRAECERNYARPVQMFFAKEKNEQGYEDRNSAYLYPPEKGRRHQVGKQWLQWCPHCYSSYALLELGEEINYPRFQSTTYVIEKGVEAWIDFAVNSSVFQTVLAREEVAARFPDKWQRTLNVIVK